MQVRDIPLLKHRFYEVGEVSFPEMVAGLLGQYRKENAPIRLVFFGMPEDNEKYLSQCDCLRTMVKARFKEEMPLVSYVAQPPCAGGLIMEVHELAEPADEMEYLTWAGVSYIVAKGENYKWLFLGGMQGDILSQCFREQADAIFAHVGQVLNHEQMAGGDIVRQWNYIEGITDYDANGHQHYQDFNDARSAFYEQAEWENGYPAATGIGAWRGGIVVDADVLKTEVGTVCVAGVDNPLQIAAHAYSQDVLLGETLNRLRTTPKFERAKVVRNESQGLVFISGTAAIRGEQSLEGIDVAGQTLATLENIEYLVSMENLGRAGVPAGNVELNGLRVYIKPGQDWKAVKEVVEGRYPDLQVSYLFTDICRRELLVEIEGLASLKKSVYY